MNELFDNYDEKIKLLVNKFSREFFIVGLGQIFSVLGSFISVRVLTEFVSTSEYGSLSLAIFTTQFSIQLFSGPMNNAFTRYYSIAADEQNLPEFYKSLNTLLILSSIINLAVGAIVIILIENYYGDNISNLLWLSLIASILTGASSIINGIQSAARNRLNVSIHQALLIWFKLAFALLFIRLITTNAKSVLIGYVLASLIIFISEYCFLIRSPFYTYRLNTNLKSEWIRTLINYASPFFFWGGFTWFLMSSDRWALEIFSTRSEIGIYAAVYQVGYLPMTLIAGVFNQFLNPIIFQRAGNTLDQNRKNQAMAITRWTTISSLVFTLVVFLFALRFHAPVFNLFVGKEYRQASYLFPFLILAGGLFETGQFAAVKHLTSNTPNKLLLPKIATSILGIFMIFLGASMYRIDGVAGAMVLFSFIYLLWVVFLK